MNTRWSVADPKVQAQQPASHHHLVNVDVLPDDCRRLAAQLQGDGLDVLAGCLGHQSTHGAAACERHLRTAGHPLLVLVLSGRGKSRHVSFMTPTLSTPLCAARAAPALGPKPGTTFSTPGGMPASSASCPILSPFSGVCSAICNSQTRCAERGGGCAKRIGCEFCSVCGAHLDDDGVAAGQGGRDLPDHHQDGEAAERKGSEIALRQRSWHHREAHDGCCSLPWHDLAHHANGLLDGVCKGGRGAQPVVAARRRDCGPCDLVAPARIVPERHTGGCSIACREKFVACCSFDLRLTAGLQRLPVFQLKTQQGLHLMWLTAALMSSPSATVRGLPLSSVSTNARSWASLSIRSASFQRRRPRS